MKKLWLLLFFTISIGVVCANPLLPIFLSRVWFDDTDSLYVQISDELGGAGPLCLYNFHTPSGQYHLPYSYIDPIAYPAIINLSRYIPELSIDRQAGFLRVTTPYIAWLDELLTWGDETTDPQVNIHPLSEGQCAVHFRVMNNDGTLYTWAKEYNSNYGTPSIPQSMCDLNIQVRDQYANPLPNYRIYVSYRNVTPPYTSGAFPTSPNGTVTAIAYPAHVWVFIRDPVANEVVWSGNTYLEPNFPNYLNATITVVSNEDETLLPLPGNLSVQPSIVYPGIKRLKLSYDKPSDLSGTINIGLYDLRGRLVYTYLTPQVENYRLDLPELSSGIYFLHLSVGDRRMGTAKFTVIK